MMKSMTANRIPLMALVLLLLAAGLGACTHPVEEMASIPNDYHLRHPIVIREANHSIDIFVGSGRGGLSALQRADVAGVAQSWMQEGTGTIVIDVPVNTPNARTAADTYHEVRSILVAGGVPASGIVVRNYYPRDPRRFATIRLSYPKIAADAGPCGLWPEDLGPSPEDKGYLDNKPFYNLGCAQQHNLAAMIDNPSDLVQPRPETPAYTARRNIAFDRYRKGEATTTAYTEADKAKLSDSGK
jgi:pilus assembly protein CpaD